MTGTTTGRVNQHGFKIHEWTQRVMHEYAKVTEEQMALYIKPPPRFIPARWWYWLVGKFLLRTIERKW